MKLKLININYEERIIVPEKLKKLLNDKKHRAKKKSGKSKNNIAPNETKNEFMDGNFSDSECDDYSCTYFWNLLYKENNFYKYIWSNTTFLFIPSQSS